MTPDPRNRTVSQFSNAAFDVVAMAASAGGLPALSHVLSNLPPDFPAAIVMVQHLDPRHRSLMADILSRRMQFKVQQGGRRRSARPRDHLTRRQPCMSRRRIVICS